MEKTDWGKIKPQLYGVEREQVKKNDSNKNKSTTDIAATGIEIAFLSTSVTLIWIYF